MNLKTVVIAVLAALVACGASFGSGWVIGRTQGYSACQDDQRAAEQKQLKADNVAVKEVRQVAEKRAKTIIKIKEVIRNVPAKDCIDMPLPELDDGVHEAYIAATRSASY